MSTINVFSDFASSLKCVNYFAKGVHNMGLLRDNPSLIEPSSHVLDFLQFSNTFSHVLLTLEEDDALTQKNYFFSALESGLSSVSYVLCNFFPHTKSYGYSLDFSAEICGNISETIELYQAYQEIQESDAKNQSNITDIEKRIYSEKKKNAYLSIARSVISLFLSLSTLFSSVFTFCALSAYSRLVTSCIALSLGIVSHFYEELGCENQLRKEKKIAIENLSIGKLVKQST